MKILLLTAFVAIQVYTQAQSPQPIEVMVSKDTPMLVSWSNPKISDGLWKKHIGNKASASGLSFKTRPAVKFYVAGSYKPISGRITIDEAVRLSYAPAPVQRLQLLLDGLNIVLTSGKVHAVTIFKKKRGRIICSVTTMRESKIAKLAKIMPVQVFDYTQ
jgi:hypothetical protein